MNTNTLNKLTYGMFILSSKKHSKSSGCIIDTCIQVGTNPDQILISVMNTNYTKKIIKDSDVFCVAILDEDCPFELIKHFGFQSSADVDKFDGLTTFEDINGVPCILSHVCATISAKVVDSVNIGSHTIFVGKIKDQKHLSDVPPMTYAYYQAHIKPKMNSQDYVMTEKVKTEIESEKSCERKKQMDKELVNDIHTEKNTDKNTDKNNEKNNDKRIIGWKCSICGFVFSDPEIPNDYTCEVCGHPVGDFVAIYESCDEACY